MHCSQKHLPTTVAVFLISSNTSLLLAASKFPDRDIHPIFFSSLPLFKAIKIWCVQDMYSLHFSNSTRSFSKPLHLWKSYRSSKRKTETQERTTAGLCQV